jgi:hypothetical protein
VTAPANACACNSPECLRELFTPTCLVCYDHARSECLALGLGGRSRYGDVHMVDLVSVLTTKKKDITHRGPAWKQAPTLVKTLLQSCFVRKH